MSDDPCARVLKYFKQIKGYPRSSIFVRFLHGGKFYFRPELKQQHSEIIVAAAVIIVVIRI
jgi:hypothetical protein